VVLSQELALSRGFASNENAFFFPNGQPLFLNPNRKRRNYGMHTTVKSTTSDRVVTSGDKW